MTEPDKKAWSELMTRLVGFLEQTYLFRLSRERREQLQLLGVKISLSFPVIDFSQSNSVLGLASELNSQPACRIQAKDNFENDIFPPHFSVPSNLIYSFLQRQSRENTLFFLA